MIVGGVEVIFMAPNPIQLSWPFSGWRQDWVPNEFTPDRLTPMKGSWDVGYSENAIESQ